MTSLHVWLDGRAVAVVSQARGRMAMSYTAGARPLGHPLVSVAMPAASRRYGDRPVRAFFSGLLPEGEARAMIAYDLGLAVDDDMGMLAALGRDCAGALVIMPGDGPVSSPDPPVEDHVLDDAEVSRRLAALPTQPLGVDDLVRVSLAGVQPKLLLRRDGRGSWCLPTAGRPSTHILKPESGNLPGMVLNEAFCMAVAHRAGLPAATTNVVRFGEREVLVSERYDRRVDDDGNVTRVHQEDACQALSILTRSPGRKYQSGGGPTLRAIAGILRQWGEPGGLDDLLRQVALNMVVGNADYHGKNVSFLHGAGGRIRLAPAYDVMCTVSYRGQGGSSVVSTELGLFVAGATDITRVAAGDLRDEAIGWGMARDRVEEVLGSVLERFPDAVSAAADDVQDTPAPLIDLVAERAQAIRW